MLWFFEQSTYQQNAMTNLRCCCQKIFILPAKISKLIFLKIFFRYWELKFFVETIFYRLFQNFRTFDEDTVSFLIR